MALDMELGPSLGNNGLGYGTWALWGQWPTTFRDGFSPVSIYPWEREFLQDGQPE